MPLLPLAVEVTEIIAKARDSETLLDAATTADCLLAAHPEAEVSKDDVRDAVVCAASDAGVPAV